MLNLCTPEAPERKFYLRTSSSRKIAMSLQKGQNMMPGMMDYDKENETPNFPDRK